MREIIQLQEGDSASVARDKLAQAQSRRVALVVPPDSAVANSELDLRLIRRCAEALAIDLVLVTAHGRTRNLAQAAGLRTARTAGRAQRLPIWRSQPRRPPAGPIASAGAGRSVGSAWQFGAPSAAPPRRGAALSLMPKSLSPLGQQLLVMGVGLGASMLVLLGLILAAPSATVVLNPKGVQAKAELAIVASPGQSVVDFTSALVPASTVHLEVIGEQVAQTTGRKTVSDKHATGEVVFANKTLQEVTVPKGTIVRTSHGEPIRFFTVLDTTVPGSFGAIARAPVMAFEPGPVGNVGALTIRVVEGEPSFQVDVLNDRPMHGGSVTRVGLVSARDHDSLRAALVQKLQQEAHNQLVAGLSQGEWVPPDALDVAIAEETFDRKVDEEADTLRLRMKVRVTGLIVDGGGTRALLTRALETQHGGLMVNDASLRVQQPVGSPQVQGGEVHFRASGDALMVPAINLQAASAGIAGQDPASAALWLAGQYDLPGPPQIRVSPGWWPRLPWIPARIRVELAGGR